MYYDEITYKRLTDSVTGSEYILTTIPKMDSNGNLIPLRKGFANDKMNSGLEDSISFGYRHNASFVANASRFNMSSNIVYGIQIQDGVVLQDTPYGDNWTLGIKADNTLACYDSTHKAIDLINDGVVNSFSGFYPMIQNGSPVASSTYQAQGDPNGDDPRQAIGQMPNGDIIFLTVEGMSINSVGMTYADMIRVFQGLGVTTAYNFDGGGSQQTIVRGTMLTAPTDNYGLTVRPVIDFLYVDAEDVESVGVPAGPYMDLEYLSKRITDLIANLHYRAPLFTSIPNATDLGNLGVMSGEFWAHGTTPGVPNTSCSWKIYHTYIDSKNQMQVAIPFSSDTTIKSMRRRTDSTGAFQPWINL